MENIKGQNGYVHPLIFEQKRQDVKMVTPNKEIIFYGFYLWKLIPLFLITYPHSHTFIYKHQSIYI